MSKERYQRAEERLIEALLEWGEAVPGVKYPETAPGYVRANGPKLFEALVLSSDLIYAVMCLSPKTTEIARCQAVLYTHINMAKSITEACVLRQHTENADAAAHAANALNEIVKNQHKG